MTAALIESALRALVFALAVWASLRALGVRNVVALKAAWGMVLCAALTMPLLLSLAARWSLLPGAFSIVLPARPFHWLNPSARATALPVTRNADSATLPGVSLKSTSRTSAAEVAQIRSLLESAEALQHAMNAQSVSGQTGIAPSASAVPSDQGMGSRFPAPVVAQVEPHGQSSAKETHPKKAWLPHLTALKIVWTLYAVGALLLLGRLLYGVAAALRLSITAAPVSLISEPDLAEEIALRTSNAVSSPVTIGSVVVLPGDYATWSREKLRIVLAHERSHIRQRDFYLQLAAGVYAAVFWVSPLGWWLKRKLSELAEAISDRAGLAEAASRSSYAQILLEFAAMPRPTQLGVAMARTGNLSRRIERLLNETTFRQAYAATRLRALAVALLVPAALFVATAMIHVQAAAQSQETAPPPPPAITSSPKPPDPAAAPAPASVPSPLEGQSTPPEPPNVDVTVPTPQATPAPQSAPAPPAMPGNPASPAVAPLPPPQPDDSMAILDNDEEPMVTMVDNDGAQTNIRFARNLMMRKDDNGDTYILVRGNRPIATSGPEAEALQKARKITKGDFVLYTHKDRSYVIDDPATIKQIENSFGPGHMMAFKFKFKTLQDQQFKMAQKHDEFARLAKDNDERQKVFMLQHKQMSDEQAAKILQSADLQKQMASLNATMSRLKAEDNKKLTEQDLALVRAQVAELQAKLGAMQWNLDAMAMPNVDVELPKIEIDTRMADMDARVAESMSRAAEAQAHFAAEQEKIQKDNDQKLKAIIDQSLKNGTAKPIQ